MILKTSLPVTLTVLTTLFLICLGIAPNRVGAQNAETYTLEVMAVDKLYITDSKGNTNRQISCCADIAVPGVVYEYGSGPDSKEKFLFPHVVTFLNDATFDIKFRTTSDPASTIQITRGMGKGQGNYTDLLIRYLTFRDLDIPPGVEAWLRFTPAGVSNLRLDKNGDGKFETEVAPEFLVAGKDAADDKRPIVTISAEVSGNFAVITITASDLGTGVKTIRYQVGDGVQEHPTYTGPFQVDISKPLNVWGVASDRAGNIGLMIKSFGTGDEERLRNENPVQRKYLDRDPFKLKSIPF